MRNTANPIIVHRRHGSTYLPGIIVTKAGERDLTTYAIDAYAFLLPRHGDFTADDLADAIEATYSTDNERNAAIIHHLRGYTSCNTH